MDRVDNDDWKNNFEFKINYKSDQSTDNDDFEEGVVVMRAPRGRQSAVAMLADQGDGADADLLGTTPPRTRIRTKEKKRSVMDSDGGLQGRSGDARRSFNSVSSPNTPVLQERLKKRLSLKMLRSQERDLKQEYGSLPSPGTPTAPTVVESCNRFMSLSSWLKSRNADSPVELREGRSSAEVPESRVNFHNTFSMLINMGNTEKGCRRTISREEQVWQNSLKDMIWLELQARLAGRELPAHDAWLMSRRRHLPALVRRVLDYRFQYPSPCGSPPPARPCDDRSAEQHHHECSGLCCGACAGAVSSAEEQLRRLLDAEHRAAALYPSSCAMTRDHPQLATPLYRDRIQAMCLWYNTALHLRLKLASVLRLVRTLRDKATSDWELGAHPACNTRKSTESERQVRESPAPAPAHPDNNHQHYDTQHTLYFDVSAGTPYSSADSNGSSDSGYSGSVVAAPVLDQHSLAQLSHMRLLGRCDVSPFRRYHMEILKTQGVRRCMMFINKMTKNILYNAYLTLEKPDETSGEAPGAEAPGAEAPGAESPGDVTSSTLTDAAARLQELHRYGCWSEQSLAMGLPSYRNYFLLLNCLCMEVVHDYLSLRIEDRPQQPSCLTIKQLIHELKAGLDIATEVRVVFARNVRAALRGGGVSDLVRRDLLLLLTNYDATVDDLLQLYVSYLVTMSRVEMLSRATLQTEWAFATTLASRRPTAAAAATAAAAPTAFAEIACNQLDRLVTQFEEKFQHLHDTHNNDNAGSKEWMYGVCRAAQDIFVQQREGTLQAATWARALAGRLTAARRYRPQRAAVLRAALRLRATIARHLLLILERSRALDAADPVLPRVRELLLHAYRLAFEIHKQLHRFVKEQQEHSRAGAAVAAGAGAAGAAGAEGAGRSRHKLHRVDSTLDDDVIDGNLFNQIHNPTENQMTIEQLLGGGEPGDSARDSTEDPLQEEEDCVEEEEFINCWAREVAYAIVDFAKCWMTFVVEKCERGRGRRPRWASQGLEFLMLACDPNNTKHLTDEEFEELKQRMDGCISHVVGSRSRPPSPPPPRAAPRPRHLQSPMASPPPGAEEEPPPLDVDPVLVFGEELPTPQQRRVWAAVQRLEAARGASARGRVLRGGGGAGGGGAEPALKRLSFKWQRGLKIGAGTFGKVYTVVNTATGQLLAMKELQVAAGDRRALQRAANELQLLEGVLHPHLVTYYGCEVHREEMLIFMELCVEGSLEALVCGSGPLPELAARRYTKQLVSAVAELHARNIVHRDIKSGNIFLTNEGNCLKLGDFGSAVKIRAAHTAPGELQGFVGTQAYMAPEVFMKSSGHGRAADIWSLGCVVTEMASGQRPFAEYDSNYQIMFVVGMGGRPRVPEALSAEGRDLCSRCLTHEPEQRPRAGDLAAHHFLMVKSEEDCKCEPAYLIT